MELPSTTTRHLARTARTALRQAHSSQSCQNVLSSGITQPMAIWSCRHFSTSKPVLYATPLSQFGGSGSGAPSYFQGSIKRLPTNTIVKFVPQQQAWIVERFGKFTRTLKPGLAILIPFIDRIAYVQSLKESALSIPSQTCITADNVTLDLDGILYTRVLDPYAASYGVEDAEYAISQLAQTTMRSEIGQLTLDHVLKERAGLNERIRTAINEASMGAWGVECLRYEIRDIHVPESVRGAMHRQVTAERSKRAEILESEGQRQSAINIAEGRKQSVILASEAMRAESINEAEGQAQAILMKAQATARGIDSVAESLRQRGEQAQGAVSLSVAEKYIEAFGRLAKEGTAVVVPGNVGDMSGMIAQAMAVYGQVTKGQTPQRSSGEITGKSSGREQKMLEDSKSKVDQAGGGTEQVRGGSRDSGYLNAGDQVLGAFEERRSV